MAGNLLLISELTLSLHTPRPVPLSSESPSSLASFRQSLILDTSEITGRPACLSVTVLNTVVSPNKGSVDALLHLLCSFMPRVEIVQKHNTAARRLYIRGHNGKIYPYLVMNDACLTESRREERVLQLLRLLNPCLEKRKETTKRHLFFTGMRATSM